MIWLRDSKLQKWDNGIFQNIIELRKKIMVFHSQEWFASFKTCIYCIWCIFIQNIIIHLFVILLSLYNCLVFNKGFFCKFHLIEMNKCKVCPVRAIDLYLKVKLPCWFFAHCKEFASIHRNDFVYHLLKNITYRLTSDFQCNFSSIFTIQLKTVH